MKTALLELLRCPTTGQLLTLEVGGNNSLLINEGWLVSEDGQHRYPIRNGIPRFVPQSNYADNFGMQWNYFRQTQLDSHSGMPISSARFWLATNWAPADLKGRWVLDVGCGAGRFAEVALKAGAKVVALDYSSAVDACYSNLKHHPNLHVVQGDIYALPFALGAFQYVYSLGVLQHTPDVAKAFAALPPMVRGGGSCAWIITKNHGNPSFTPNTGCGRYPNAWLKPRFFRCCKRRYRFCCRSAVFWAVCHLWGVYSSAWCRLLIIMARCS